MHDANRLPDCHAARRVFRATAGQRNAGLNALKPTGAHRPVTFDDAARVEPVAPGVPGRLNESTAITLRASTGQLALRHQ